jgi:hypothetical protein
LFCFILRIPCWKGLRADSGEKQDLARTHQTSELWTKKKGLTANGRIEKLPKVVRGVKFHNGVEVIETPADHAA